MTRLALVVGVSLPGFASAKPGCAAEDVVVDDKCLFTVDEVGT